MNDLKAILRYPGSKWRIADWIVSQIPPHRTYLEPFFGSGAVFFRKQPSPIETINDIDDDVVNLFRIIRDYPQSLINAVNFTPYAKVEYDHACATTNDDDDIERARLFLIRCWQGHGFRTTQSHTSGWKNDIQGREAAYAMRDWFRLPFWISSIVSRLKTVQIDNRPALEIIRKYNYPNVFIYCDPPYVLSTRRGNQYKYEMTDKDHIDLLKALNEHRGSAIISGYECELYNEYLYDWEKLNRSNTDQSGHKRIETIWIKR